MTTKHYSSGSSWEDIVGYSRAVLVGDHIEVAGTTAVDEAGIIHGEGDPYQQTKYIIQKAIKAIEALGGSRSTVYRTRMFVTDISNWEAIGKAHGEFFKSVKPAATMVEVSKLIDPGLLVEIEFTAFVAPLDLP